MTLFTLGNHYDFAVMEVGDHMPNQPDSEPSPRPPRRRKVPPGHDELSGIVR
jgi:hypothetical protein